jgi:prolipoprotein diacylglyceryltransferase
MNTNNGGGYLGAGMIHVPLFLVESLLNIAGYFLMVYGVGKGLKKVHRPWRFGRWLFLVVWHRPLIMEPMRDSAFNMGTDNAWSICNSIVYIVLASVRDPLFPSP